MDQHGGYNSMIIRLLLLVAALGIATVAHAVTLDKGLPATGTILPLTPTADGYEVSLDVSVDEGFSSLVVKSPDDSLKLDPKPLPTEAGAMKRVLVRVTGGRYRQGTYPITLVATKATGKIERDIWLQVPVSVLDPPVKLSIEKICWGLVIGGQCQGYESISENTPQLWENTQHGWLTNIKLQQNGDTVAGAGRTGGAAGGRS